MAEERYTTAFVVGAVLGGLAGAAATLWKIPWSGVKTRAAIAEQAEDLLFRLTGMHEWRPDNMPPRAAPKPNDAAPTPDVNATGETATLPIHEPPVPPPVEPLAEDDGAALPLTFRGETLTDRPTDVVLDGPQPAPNDH